MEAVSVLRGLFQVLLVVRAFEESSVHKVAMVANIIYAIIGHSSLSSIQAGALPIHVDDGLGEGLRGSRCTEEAAAMRIDFFRHRFSPIRLEGLDSSSEGCPPVSGC